MKFDDMEFSLSAVQWLLMAAIGVYAWIIRKDSATKAESDEKFLKYETELVAMQTRLVQLEAEMKNMPSEASVRELIGRLGELTAHNEGTKQQLNTMQHSVNRLHDYLLNKG